MSDRFYEIAALLLVLLFASSPSLAQGKRVALVIGNSDYKHTPRLENPKNDAVDMAATLKKLDFAVIEGRDVDKAGDGPRHSRLRRGARRRTGRFVLLCRARPAGDADRTTWSPSTPS